jgi:hypothetical protein
MTALAWTSSNFIRQTLPLVREDVTKEYDRKCSVEKNTGRESQVPSYQDKLIGGKLPVVK